VAIKGVNEDEVLDFANLTLTKPYQIRFIELMPVGEVGFGNNDKYMSNDSVIEKIAAFHTLDPIPGKKIKQIVPLVYTE
jgi:cyclic pyranopterin phosphate synthase